MLMVPSVLCRYHIELVRLLACCTMGKNVYTEIKCHSLLPLDDIVNMVGTVWNVLSTGCPNGFYTRNRSIMSVV